MVSILPLAFRSAAGLYPGEPATFPKAAISIPRSTMFTTPSRFKSGSLDAKQSVVAEDPVLELTEQVTANIARGTARTNLTLLLLPKARLMVKVLETMVAPVVLFTTLTEAVPSRVLAVVSTIKELETVTVTPSKLMVLLKVTV